MSKTNTTKPRLRVGESAKNRVAQAEQICQSLLEKSASVRFAGLGVKLLRHSDQPEQHAADILCHLSQFSRKTNVIFEVPLKVASAICNCLRSENATDFMLYLAYRMRSGRPIAVNSKRVIPAICGDDRDAVRMLLRDESLFRVTQDACWGSTSRHIRLTAKPAKSAKHHEVIWLERPKTDHELNTKSFSAKHIGAAAILCDVVDDDGDMCDIDDDDSKNINDTDDTEQTLTTRQQLRSKFRCETVLLVVDFQHIRTLIGETLDRYGHLPAARRCLQRFDDVKANVAQLKAKVLLNAHEDDGSVCPVTQRRIERSQRMTKNLLEAIRGENVRFRYVGGRIYHPGISCPKSVRRHLLKVDGQRCAEVDTRCGYWFSIGAFVRHAYLSSGSDVTRIEEFLQLVSSGELYKFLTDRHGRPAKRDVQVQCLFGENLCGEAWRRMKRHFGEIADFVRNARQRYGVSVFSSILGNAEAAIINPALLAFDSASRPCQRMHDGLTVAVPDIGLAVESIQQASLREFGCVPGLKITRPDGSEDFKPGWCDPQNAGVSMFKLPHAKFSQLTLTDGSNAAQMLLESAVVSALTLDSADESLLYSLHS